MIDYLSDISDNPLPVAERKSPAFIEADQNLSLTKLPTDKDFIKGSEDETRTFNNYLYRNLDVEEGKLDIFSMKNKIIQLAKEQEELERGERPAFNNSQALYEDMKDTINQFKRYVDIVEDHAKIRKYRSITYSKGDWFSYWNREKLFQEIIKNGVNVMKKFVSAITMEPHAVNVDRFIWNKEQNVPPQEYSRKLIVSSFLRKHSILQLRAPGWLELFCNGRLLVRAFFWHTVPITDKDRVKILESVGYNLMVRFTRLLEGEGVEHNLPVPPLEKKPLRFRKVSQSQTPERNHSFLADYPLNDNLSTEDSRNLRMAMKEHELTATSFLQNLAQKNNLSLHYSQVPNQIKPFSKEPYIACRFHTIGAENKGKNVLMAKQAASAQVLVTLLAKQKNGTLPEEIRYLDLAERELALSLACEHINYEEILYTMVTKLNTNRTPQYSPIFNVPNGQFSYRCKAVGFNGVGTGRTKEIAKRIAAKLVIEKIQEQKEKYLINKYGTKKAKKLIKLY